VRKPIANVRKNTRRMVNSLIEGAEGLERLELPTSLAMTLILDTRKIGELMIGHRILVIGK
jgi:hypothetical protein